MAGRRVLTKGEITGDYYLELIKEVNVVYKITGACLKCGICIPKCPAGAIIAGEPIIESDGLILQPVSIDPEKCIDCGVCVSEEYWCPAQAIVRA